jgi:hypothetical protein
MMNKFPIEFHLDGVDYKATVENYTNPGQIVVTDISPAITNFPTQLMLDKDLTKKILIYDNDLDKKITSQIIESVHRTAIEKGIPLYPSVP